MDEREYVRRARDGYDSVAVEYLDLFGDSLRERPLERAMIDVFAESVRAAGSLPVADIGCGPGFVTEYMRTLGLDVRGVDLSAEMIALARRTYPGIRFDLGDMTAVDLPDGSLGGVVSRSSIIHTPPERVGAVFAEFHRLLVPGGHLLLAFQATDATSQVAWPFDHVVAPAFRWSIGRVAALLREAGFGEVARLITAPEEDPVRGFHYCHMLTRKAQQPTTA